MKTNAKTKIKAESNIEEYIMPQEGFVRQPVVLKVLGISRSALWRGIQEGIYPRPVKLSTRTSAWRVKDIRALIRKYDDPGTAETQTP